MFEDFSNHEIFILPGATDMRKQINSLIVMANNKMGGEVFLPKLFLFCAKSRRQIRILYWERNGFCLWVKRLEKHKFPWPENESEAMKIDYKELKMILRGIDLFHAHTELKNFSVQ